MRVEWVKRQCLVSEQNENDAENDGQRCPSQWDWALGMEIPKINKGIFRTWKLFSQLFRPVKLQISEINVLTDIWKILFHAVNIYIYIHFFLFSADLGLNDVA